MDPGEIQERIALIQAELEFRELQVLKLRKELHTLSKALGKLPESNNGESTPGKGNSSPVANGSGKGQTNPLKVVDLPKIEVTQSGPDQTTEMQVDTDDGFRPAKPRRRYYTVFNGPNKGVYSNWGTVSSITTGRPYAFKAYPSEVEALKALNEGPEETEDLRPSFKEMVEARGNNRKMVALRTRKIEAVKAQQIKEAPVFLFS